MVAACLSNTSASTEATGVCGGQSGPCPISGPVTLLFFVSTDTFPSVIMVILLNMLLTEPRDCGVGKDECERRDRQWLAGCLATSRRLNRKRERGWGCALE